MIINGHWLKNEAHNSLRLMSHHEILGTGIYELPPHSSSEMSTCNINKVGGVHVCSVCVYNVKGCV